MLTAGPVIVFDMKCVIILARFRGIGKGETRNFAGNQRQTKLHARAVKRNPQNVFAMLEPHVLHVLHHQIGTHAREQAADQAHRHQHRHVV